jgi:hypothetical protein
MSNGDPRTIDPTANVLMLVEAAVRRLDDLRAAEVRRIDDLLAQHVKSTKELSTAESDRIDAIRAVDVGNVALANERAIQQAAVLADQLVKSAETLRVLVSTTAAAYAEQQSQLVGQLTERLGAVEKAQIASGASGGGKEKMWGWLAAGVLGIATLYSIFSPHLK